MKLAGPYLLALVLGLSVPSVLAADGPGITVKIPDFGKHLRLGETVSRLSLHAYCVSVTDIRRVPDGWSVSLKVDGEDGQIEVDRDRKPPRFPGMKQPRTTLDSAELDGFAIRVGYRGQWSDCAALSMSVQATGPEGASTHLYRFPLFGQREWTYEGRKPL